MREPFGPRAAPLLLVAVTGAAWGGVLDGAFQYDDFAAIVRDEATVDASALLARLSSGIRPLLRLSYFADHAIWGMRPAGFLFTNLLLHIATVLGVHALAKRLLGERGELAAFVAAALFALQPANAEVVAYVSGRSTGLMAALFVWGFVAWESERKKTALLFFVAACLAKEVAILFPVFLGVREWQRRGASPLPAWAAAVVVAAVAVAALFAASARYRELLAFSLELRSPLENLGPALRGAAIMVSLWVRPWALSVDHAAPPNSAWLTAIALAGAASLATAAFAVRRRDPLASLCLAWPLLALLPTCSIIAKLDLVTEKPLYLAWIGPAILLGRTLAMPFDSLRSLRVNGAIATAAICALAVFVPARVHVWSDARSLWADAVGKAPHNARAWNNLGHALWVDDHDDAAAFAFERSRQLDSADDTARYNRLLTRTKGTR